MVTATRSLGVRIALGITPALLLAAVGEARAEKVYAVTSDSNLVRFDRMTPGTIETSVPITGLIGFGENLVGIDFRPLTGELYGVGDSSAMYTINRLTGVATPVGAGLGAALSGTAFGVDFNPVVDRVRITSDADQNLRAHPATGLVVFTDAAIKYAAIDSNFGANPNVVASAYSNNFAGTLTTTLYDIDADLDILATQSPPNDGTLNTIGSLGISVGGFVGFDIAALDGKAFASFQNDLGSPSSFYQIDLGTGAASLVGGIGNNAVIRAIALVPEPTGLALLGFGVICAIRRRAQAG